VAQKLLACGLFAREDTLKVARLFELYFLYSMLQGDYLHPGSVLFSQLHSAAISSTQRIMIGALLPALLCLLVLTYTPMIQFPVLSG